MTFPLMAFALGAVFKKFLRKRYANPGQAGKIIGKRYEWIFSVCNKKKRGSLTT